jgi:hypothetical protein
MSNGSRREDRKGRKGGKGGKGELYPLAPLDLLDLYGSDRTSSSVASCTTRSSGA